MTVLPDYQRLMLRELSLPDGERRDRWNWGSSSTNPTGSALKRRGLAWYEWDRSKPYTWGRWILTDAGRALAEAELAR